MKKTKFIEELSLALLGRGDGLREDQALSSIPEWDSMGQMAVLTLLDSITKVSVPANALSQCKTVADVLKLVEKQLES